MNKTDKKIEEIDNLVDELLYDYGFTTDKCIVAESYREMGKDMAFKLKQKHLNLLNTEVQKEREEALKEFADFLHMDPYQITSGSTDYFQAMQLFEVWRKRKLDKGDKASGKYSRP